MPATREQPLPQLEKTPRSSEDPAQPEINKYFFKELMAVHVSDLEILIFFLSMSKHIPPKISLAIAALDLTDEPTKNKMKGLFLKL